MYRTNAEDPSRRLSVGSRFSIAYTLEANVKPSFRQGGISSHLGVLEVDWVPTALPLPAEVELNPNSAVGIIQAHGPLVLQKPSKIRFRGPPYYIESTPFEAKLLRVPFSPCVANPFEVCYKIENKTHLHQLLTIRMNVPSLADAADGLLLCGEMVGELTLGPNENRTLTYSFIATRPGPLKLPALHVASDRYKSWVIHEEGTSDNVFVFP
jgi:hypothetical protein